MNDAERVKAAYERLPGACSASSDDPQVVSLDGATLTFKRVAGPIDEMGARAFFWELVTIDRGEGRG